MPFSITTKLIGAPLVTASTGIALSSSKPLAAQPSQAFPRPESVEQHRSKLNLYEEAPKPVILVPEKSPFQDEVAQVRAVIQDATQGLRSSTADGRATWINWERRAEDSVQRVVSSKDQLNPGAMYVAIVTLAGSILGRNRNILVRAALPPAFLLLSLDYFLPHTATNVWSKLKAVEAAHFPQMRDAREKVSSMVHSNKQSPSRA